jgi:hypothetical protein
MITPEIIDQVLVGIAINAVLTLSKKVKTKIAVIAAKRIRRVLPLLHHANHPPKITGITGRTQGARTERIQDRKETRMMSMKRY